MPSIKGERSPPVTNPDLLRDVISILFLHVSSEAKLSNVQVNPDEISTDEFFKDVNIVENKVPGLDCILNDALIVAVKMFPNWFAERFMGYGFYQQSVCNRS